MRGQGTPGGAPGALETGISERSQGGWEPSSTSRKGRCRQGSSRVPTHGWRAGQRFSLIFRTSPVVAATARRARYATKRWRPVAHC
jgi:hypothetical protein